MTKREFEEYARMRDEHTDKIVGELKAQTGMSLQLRDTLNDLLLGVDLWKNGKVSSGDWTDRDEMLARWVEAGEARDDS